MSEGSDASALAGMRDLGAPGRLTRLRALELPGRLAIFVAAGPRARLLGLAGLASLPHGAALLLPRCRSVHTFGMRFSIDVVFLAADGTPVGVAERLRPRRLAGRRAARAVLETPSGESGRFVAALERAGGLPALV